MILKIIPYKLINILKNYKVRLKSLDGAEYEYLINFNPNLAKSLCRNSGHSKPHAL